MTLIEKLFALNQHPFLRSVEDSELILIAEVAVAREFQPGACIVPSGTVLNRLLVVTAGKVIAEESGKPADSLIGIESLVLERPAGDSLIADEEEGATCLMIAKGHFFTIINECPEILVRYLEQSRRSTQTESPDAAASH